MELDESLLIRSSAGDLQAMLTQGRISSVQLVKACLAQIERYDRRGPCLRAMISIPSEQKLLEIASNLDQERQTGRLRGQLHGIPVVVKDCIGTDASLGMPTTLGSYAFDSAIHRTGASVIKQLREKGMIILGKTNLSELLNWKGERITCGWSALGGQCQSAYVKGGVIPGDDTFGESTPGGSSSGSAVAVAAGYSPVSIGTESDGSIIHPAARSALYGLKLTPGSVDMSGIFTTSKTFDTAGPMAKTVSDLAALADCMTDHTYCGEFADGPFTSCLAGDWSQLQIGMVDPSEWKLPTRYCKHDEAIFKEVKDTVLSRMERMREAGATIVYPIEMPKIDGDEMLPVLLHESREHMERFFNELDDSDTRTLEDLIAFNKTNSTKELPDRSCKLSLPVSDVCIADAGLEYPSQSRIQQSADWHGSIEDYNRNLRRMRERALHQTLQATLKKYSIDVIVAPMDSTIGTVAAKAGGPIATAPIGIVSSTGRPFGLGVLARPHGEKSLFRFLSAYEATFPDRAIPSVLLEEYDASGKM